MEPHGDPKMEPKSQDFQKKINFGVLPTASGKEIAKNNEFGTPLKAENEAGA